jgi:hypothetical protein
MSDYQVKGLWGGKSLRIEMGRLPYFLRLWERLMGISLGGGGAAARRPDEADAVN